MEKQNKIDSSLTYGKILSSGQIYLLYSAIIISLMLPLCSIVIIILLSLGIIESNSDVIGSLIFGNIFSLFLFTVCLDRYIYNYKLKRKVKLWLEDAVMLKAKAKRLDLINPIYKPYQIEVKFTYGEKKVRIISSPGSAIRGYYKFFKENRKELDILYSKKYNEVLILKQ